MKKIILSVIIGLSFINSFAFQFVGEGLDCLDYNNAKFAKALIEIVGKDSVIRFLEGNHYVSLAIKLDQNSRFKEIYKFRNQSDSKVYNDTVLTYQFELYEMIHRDTFLFCRAYEYDLMLPWAISSFYTYKVSVATCVFPSWRLNRYEYAKKEYQAKGIELSKYEYLLMFIQKYENLDDYIIDPWNQEKHFLR